MSRYIQDWEELASIPQESKTHILKIDLNMGNAWLEAKNPKPYNPKYSYMRQAEHLDYYLSTHTFYGKNYIQSTNILRMCGFDVTLANWDSKGETKWLEKKDLELVQ